MTDLVATPGLDAVVQLEINTQALGGPGGPMNQQAQALLNRTQFLVDQLPQLAACAWVEVSGNDATAQVGNSGLPFLTINAALDALPSSGGVIYAGWGTFSPIHDDYDGTMVPDPTSKLKSNVAIIGVKKPSLNDEVAPTKLQNGTVIQGPLVFHSTRFNIRLACLGIDAGSDVCTALYGGVAQEGLVFANIPQTVGLAPAPGVQLFDVISLSKAASALTHTVLLENLKDPRVLGLTAYYGFAGVAIKAIGGIFTGIHSYGHALAPLYFKDDSYARCYGCVASDVVVGELAAGDTPNGLYFTAGGSTDLDRITVSGIQTIGVTNDIKIDALSTGITKNVRVDGLQGDTTYPRISVVGNSVDATTFRVNGKPLQGTVVLADAATINTDASKGSGAFSITLGAVGRTLANPTNLENGQTYVWEIKQDATGGRTITSYGSLFTFSGGTIPTQSAGASAVDLLTAIYDGTKLRCVYSKGFA